MDEIDKNILGYQFSKSGTKFYTDRSSASRNSGNTDSKTGGNQNRRNNRNYRPSNSGRQQSKYGGGPSSSASSSNKTNVKMDVES